MTSINIDHNKGIISTESDSILYIADKGAVKIGDGTYLDELGNSREIEARKDYIGAMRYNKDRGCLQICDGTKWKDVLGHYKQTSNIVWSLLF